MSRDRGSIPGAKSRLLAGSLENRTVGFMAQPLPFYYAASFCIPQVAKGLSVCFTVGFLVPRGS